MKYIKGDVRLELSEISGKNLVKLDAHMYRADMNLILTVNKWWSTLCRHNLAYVKILFVKQNIATLYKNKWKHNRNSNHEENEELVSEIQKYLTFIFMYNCLHTVSVTFHQIELKRSSILMVTIKDKQIEIGQRGQKRSRGHVLPPFWGGRFMWRQ